MLSIFIGSSETEWECTSSKCYRFDGRTLKWQDAHDFCPTLGPITTVAGERTPTLLFAGTEEGSQLAILKALFRSVYVPVVWINCNEMETEGLYMCDVGGTEAVQINSTSKNWESGYPSGNGNEKCVLMTEQYKWRGSGCNHDLLSICQIVL
ncbi:pulmonary surfactant-associated protein A-like [Strongylocentrotus purpuratus]|uniref:C-type lectin domain-containing protein n=1 Tax=Strongylocentrotus purpuratus TaxID=7668 RepID=A0A7M7PES8_STRPU|nr:pulmonary surfactant-associated protein A-like [Strongylocentrotus purpuratus]